MSSCRHAEIRECEKKINALNEIMGKKDSVTTNKRNIDRALHLLKAKSWHISNSEILRDKEQEHLITIADEYITVEDKIVTRIQTRISELIEQKNMLQEEDNKYHEEERRKRKSR